MTTSHPRPILWLLRHAVAVEADRFDGDDLARPLTPEGRRIARHVFARLAAVCPAPDRVFSSEAVRARQTADLFIRAFGQPGYTVDPALNPGARPRAIRALALAALAGCRHVVLVGHEPDFSRAAARLLEVPDLDLKLEKAGLVELELNARHTFRLRAVIPPDLLAVA